MPTTPNFHNLNISRTTNLPQSERSEPGSARSMASVQRPQNPRRCSQAGTSQPVINPISNRQMSSLNQTTTSQYQPPTIDCFDDNDLPPDFAPFRQPMIKEKVHTREDMYQRGNFDDVFGKYQNMNAWSALQAKSDAVPDTTVSCLTRSDSASSVNSFLGSRAGVLSPPDTLSTQVIGICAKTAGAFIVLIESAAKNNFLVHANVTDHHVCKEFVCDQLTKNGFVCTSADTDTLKIFGHPNNQARVTISISPNNTLPAWSEDVIFMGKTKAHVVEGSFTPEANKFHNSDIMDSITAKRIETYQSMGVKNPEKFSELMGVGASYNPFETQHEGTLNIPKSTQVFNPNQQDGVREIRTIDSIAASIDGGNYLSNGAPSGSQIHIIGEDAVAATMTIMQKKAEASPSHDQHAADISYNDAVQQIKNQFHADGDNGDRLIIIPQMSFHIDMSMTFVSEKEVVLSDSQQFYDITGDDHDETSKNKCLVENATKIMLEDAGLIVHSVPWSSPKKAAMSCFNGEFVKSQNDNDKVLFLTNHAVFLKDEHAEIIHDSVTDFYKQRDIEVIFAPKFESSEFLKRSGGIGCKVNSMHA